MRLNESNLEPHPRSLSTWMVIAVPLALLLLLTSSAFAGDSLEKRLKFDYLDKVLTLRHFYSGDHLKFHLDGTLDGNARIGPWTVDGQIEVRDIQLHGAQLVIKARRIHRIFDAQHKPQDQLTTVGNHPDKHRKELEKELRRLTVEIEIDLPRENPSEQDVNSAIHAVFLTNSESMMDIVPSYWSAYFAKQEGRPQDAPIPKGPVYRVKTGEVSPPHAIYQPDPEYSEEARKAKYQGVSVVSLIVDATGEPRDLQITGPLGLGLDEKAIEAIRDWKFKPALKDGEPVSVAVAVQVDFHLY